ncbi:MAG: cyclase family protein [Cryobacterium sp.]|nr:cyclase family protein [Cryobacterium sp.]
MPDAHSSTPPFRLARDEYDSLTRRVANWQRWPTEGGLGALHTITAEKRVRSAQLVTEGRVVSCCQPPRGEAVGELGEPGSSPHPYRVHQWFAAREGWHAVNDRVEIDVHGLYSMTHLDGLGHFFLDDRGFDGVPRPELQSGLPEQHAAITAAGGIVSRGVLIDIPRFQGRDAMEAGDVASLHDVKGALQQQGVQPEPGDILAFRFGTANMRPRTGPETPLPGLSIECADWLHEQDCAVVITDGGLDPSPSQVEGISTPWHLLVLASMGVRLIDGAELNTLSGVCAELGRWEFQMIVAPIAVPHASGVPVNPLAIF